MTLEWTPPADSGGRSDVTYRVVCRRCTWDPEECVPCGSNAVYVPQQAGLTDTYVTISELLAHANYTFEVEAVNGVSDLSRTQRLFASVSIATSQAGKRCRRAPAEGDAESAAVATPFHGICHPGAEKC